MNLTYTTGIPDGPHNPSADQSPMKVNNDSNATLWTIDHFGFNDNLGGYHNIIHQPIQGSDPAVIANINQIYAKSYTPDTTGGIADTQLFTITGTAPGKISQLTGNLTSNTTDGWVWAGGILIQWGFVSFSTSSGIKTNTVTFKDRVAGAIPFPNKCFEVIAVLSSSNGSPPIAPGSALSIPNTQITNTTFKYYAISTGNYNGFSWVAIGN